MSTRKLLNNSELSALLKKVDADAFKYIFDEYYEALVGYISTYTQNIQLSEDIIQHSFISLWQKRESLQHVESPKSYLYKIAYNRYLDIYRKEKRKSDLLERLQLENLNTRIEEDQEFLKKRLEMLRKHIQQLPPRCKEILQLSRQRGLSHKEISEKLNISTKTVEQQIRIAFKKIRKSLRIIIYFYFLLET